VSGRIDGGKGLQGVRVHQLRFLIRDPFSELADPKVIGLLGAGIGERVRNDLHGDAGSLVGHP
jgi:hypothetical protein